jgi:hypothetical protein
MKSAYQVEALPLRHRQIAWTSCQVNGTALGLKDSTSTKAKVVGMVTIR